MKDYSLPVRLMEVLAEEAAGQGIIAGINAVQYIRNRDPVILDRSQGYIGVLIDDLVTKEPMSLTG